MEDLALVLIVAAVNFSVLLARLLRNRGGETPPGAKRGPWTAAAQKPLPRRVLRGRAYVIDGDTIAIKRVKLRLAGIDAPELDMPYGQKSKWAMVNICKGNEVTAVLNGETSYDRVVAKCYLPDGRDIGAELVKRGLALDLPHFSGGAYRCFEPNGARRKLGHGMFGHRSKWDTPLGQRMARQRGEATVSRR